MSNQSYYPISLDPTPSDKTQRDLVPSSDWNMYLDGVKNLEVKVGIDGSIDPASIDYKITHDVGHLLNYLYLPGRSGGQVASGGTGASETLTLHGSKGAGGKIGLGKVPSYPIHIYGNDSEATLAVEGGDNAARVGFYTVNNDQPGSVLYLNKSRGTMAARTVVAANDIMGSVNFRALVSIGGFNVDTIGAAISGSVEAGVGVGSLPSSLIFAVVPNSDTALVEAMRINSKRWVGFGTAIPCAEVHLGSGYDLLFSNNGTLRWQDSADPPNQVTILELSGTAGAIDNVALYAKASKDIYFCPGNTYIARVTNDSYFDLKGTYRLYNGLEPSTPYNAIYCSGNRSTVIDTETAGKLVFNCASFPYAYMDEIAIHAHGLYASVFCGGNVGLSGTIGANFINATTFSGGSMQLSGNIASNLVSANFFSGGFIQVTGTVMAYLVQGNSFSGESMQLSGIATASVFKATQFSGGIAVLSAGLYSDNVTTYTFSGGNIGSSGLIAASEVRASTFSGGTLAISGAATFLSTVDIIGAAAGNPVLSFYQTTTQKGYLQYLDTNDYMRLVDNGVVGICQKSGQVTIGSITNAPSGDLHVRVTSYTATPICERYTATQTALQAALRIRATCTDTSSNTFGPAIAFDLVDTDAATTVNLIGYFGAERAGADNSGDLVFYSYATGVGAERFRISSAGIGTWISDTGGAVVSGKILRITTAKTPATSAAAGNVGEICWDTGYIYVYTATNAWKRVAIAGWS